MKASALATVYTEKKRPLSATQVRAFQKRVCDYYDTDGRDLPWRKRLTPYRVVVSEVMLQQTQVERVIEKYRQFLDAFPDFSALAAAPAAQLLAVWSGMGYNRRALALKSLAQQVIKEHGGRLPMESDKLLALPGIGKYTAGAVMAFAFNKPVVFMDTNIRRVFIHEFFHDEENIHDDNIFPLVMQTLDAQNPRRWYNALMDYGTMLKTAKVNPNRRSIHYARQSPFENSNRQVRGMIVKILVEQSPLSLFEISQKIGKDLERVKKNIEQLEREGFLAKKGENYII